MKHHKQQTKAIAQKGSKHVNLTDGDMSVVDKEALQMDPSTSSYVVMCINTIDQAMNNVSSVMVSEGCEKDWIWLV